jgi:hypothetical protein
MIEPIAPSATALRAPAGLTALPTLGESAVSWAAVFAGAAAAAALSLILLVLGTGLGFAAVSPWAAEGVSAGHLGVGTILWICIASVIASGLGGYLAGRLRVKWPGIHADEVHFRDTTHGFLAWAVATITTAAELTTALGSVIGSATQVAVTATLGAGATAGAMSAIGGTPGPGRNGIGARGDADLDYFSDSLFRPVAPGGAASAPLPASESGFDRSGSAAGRVFARNLRSGALDPSDTHYLGQLVAARTGVSQADAEKRVIDTFGRAQTSVQETQAKAEAAADQARKAAAYTSLWLFVSLLLGAFTASLCATFGGRQRDVY